MGFFKRLQKGLVISPALPSAPGEKPVASPAIRRLAMERGIDLRYVTGSGPAGRITTEDFNAYVQSPDGSALNAKRIADTSVREEIVFGLRRKIAERMVLSATRIPHITIVEELDVTSLDALRKKLNDEHTDRAKLTLLPFLMSAMVTALREQPNLNALYDDEAGVVREYGAAHIGIATQTPNGLMVPVIKCRRQ